MGESHYSGYEIVNCKFEWHSPKLYESKNSNQLKLTNDPAAGYVYADCHMDYYPSYHRDKRKVVTVRLFKTCRKPAMATIKLQISGMNSNIRNLNNWGDECISFERLSFKHDSQVCLISNDTCSEKEHNEKSHDYSIEVNCKIIWYGFVDQFYSPDSARFFMSYSENMDFCDMKIKVEDKNYPAHKFVLTSRSSVLKKTFITEMKEFKDNCIDLTDFGAEVVEEMLLFLYENRIDKAENNEELLIKLLIVGGMYEIPGLKNWCGMLLSKKLSEKNVLMLLETAHINKSPILQSRAIAYIIVAKDNFFSRSDFKELSKRHPELLADILSMMKILSDPPAENSVR